MVDNGKRKRAIIIAVSKYSDIAIETLPFCERNGQELYKVLVSLGYEIPNKYKLIGKVGSSEMHSSITDFFTDQVVKIEDTLLFYFTGHGVTDSTGNIFLAPSDICHDRPMITGLSFDKLTNLMNLSISNNIITILDCAYSAKLIGK